MFMPVSARLRYAWNKAAHNGTLYGAVFRKENPINTDLGIWQQGDKIWLEAQPNRHNPGLYSVIEYRYTNNIYNMVGEGSTASQVLFLKGNENDRLMTRKEIDALFENREAQYLQMGYRVSQKQPFAKGVISPNFRCS
jgi:hypothetical protein